MTAGDRSSALQYIILGLLVLNLALTGSLWLSRADAPAELPEAPSSLPAFANEALLEDLAERLQAQYNSGNAAALYAEFDPLAKQQFNQQDLEEQLLQLANVVGKVESSAYSHHEASRYGDFDAYVLHYQARFSGGPFPTGRMRISVIDRSGTFGLIGFKLFGGASD